MKLHVRFVGTALAVALCLVTFSPIHAQSSPASGFDVNAANLPTAAFLGGFDVLPDGRFVVFDGNSVVAFDQTTFVATTLFTPPTGAIFGAFIRVTPDGSALVFGESQFGDVWFVPLSGNAPAHILVNAGFPYDLAFSSNGDAWLSASPGFGLGNTVSRLDLVTGAVDTVLTSTGASGALAFDGDDLLYLRAPTSFPPPANSFELFRLTAAQLTSAIGPGSLVDTVDGALVAALDGGFDLEVDGEGHAYASDGSNDRITRVELATGAEDVFVDGGNPGNGITYLQFVAGSGAARFLPWQPATGGSLFGIRTDYFSFNDVVEASPRRPTLNTSAPAPMPFGPYTLTLNDAQPAAAAILLISLDGTAGGEFSFFDPQSGTPLFFGLSGQILPVAAALDASGGFAFDGFNFAIPGFVLGVQVFFGDTLTGPFRGSSEAIEVF